MDKFNLLLATDRPAIHMFFASLGQYAARPLTVSQVSVAQEVLTQQQHDAALAGANVAVIDAMLDPVTTASFCKELRALRPDLPMAALVCCPHAISALHLRRFVDAGVSSLLDLQGTAQETMRSVQSIACGSVVLRLQVGTNVSLGDVLSGYEAGSKASNPCSLSEIDIRLLQLLAAGMTDREIGKQLQRSGSTVKHHIDHLRAEMGLINRVALASWAGRNGLSHSA